jgi:predicted naringenin-chalcone synthase
MIVLKNFHKIRPKYEASQTELFDWLAAAHTQAEISVHGAASMDVQRELEHRLRFFTRFGCKPEKIAHRGMCLEDVLTKDFFHQLVYRITPSTPHGVGIGERTQTFYKIATETMRSFYSPTAEAPPHIVHVTCTGYISPSPAQSIVDERAWSGKTNVTHAYHMGCYASLPAVRLAVGLVLCEENPVDIVHTEICSLHLNPLDQGPEQAVVQSLFADGFIKYTLAQENNAGPALEVVKVSEYIIPGTGNKMTWQPVEWGMSMTLAREVPDLIGKNLEGFLEKLCADAGYRFSEIKKTASFAIHPGGPRIVDYVQELLQLQDKQIKHSVDVLYEYGNMSSATLPHIWERVVKDDTIVDSTPVISLAFGPGLTIFGAFLRKRT